MEKIKSFYEYDFRCLTKTFRIILITAYLIQVAILRTLANNAYFWKTRLWFDFSHAKPENVLDKTKSLSEFYSLPDEKLVDINRSVDLLVGVKKIDGSRVPAPFG